MSSPVSLLEAVRAGAAPRAAALDAPRDPALDELTALAAELCGTQMALVALLDGERWRFKSRAGISTWEAERSSFLVEDVPRDLLVWRDARAEGRAAGSTWVRGAPHVRFFAAVPLLAEGNYIGLLCILDPQPRELTPLQGRTLLALASAATDRLELGPNQVRELQGKLRETAFAQAQALEQLRHADRLGTVGKLTASVAHELGTPLNVVSGRAGLIEMGEVVGPEVAVSARTIVEQVERMTGMLRRLLDFARRNPSARTTQELAPLARQTLELLRPWARKSRVELEFQEPSETLSAQVDGGLVQQALANLLVNAVQANPPTGGAVRLSLLLTHAAPPEQPRHAQRCAAFRVADTGSGMPPDVLTRVFEAFFTTKPPGEGTGLGLSVTRDIVREHGGWITAQSELGRGSTFTLYLPVEVR